jgi:hypothetical protein
MTSGRPTRAISGAKAGQLAMRSIDGGREREALSARSARDTVLVLGQLAPDPPGPGATQNGSARPFFQTDTNPLKANAYALQTQTRHGDRRADTHQNQDRRARQADHRGHPNVLHRPTFRLPASSPAGTRGELIGASGVSVAIRYCINCRCAARAGFGYFAFKSHALARSSATTLAIIR